MDNNYSESKLQDPNSRIWDILSLMVILLCLLIFLLQWQQLPFFLDMYYHLAVAKGFEVAGGIVGHNFWEYAPEGGPHLYPPLLHLLMLGLLKIGLDEISMLRLFSLLIPGLLLFSLWYVIKNILTKRKAFFVVFLGLSCSLFMISASFTPAATLGMILILFGIYSIYQNRILSSALILGLIFYLHLGIAAIGMVFLILAWAFKITEKKALAKIILFLLLIGSAWLFHIIRNLSNISYQNIGTMAIRLYPVILVFFIIGAWLSLKEISKYKLFILLFLSLIPISFFYPFRFFSAQGMVGFLIFSGIGLEKFYSAIDDNLRKNKAARRYRLFFLVVLLLYLIFFAPSTHIHKKSVNFNLSDSLLTSIFEGKERDPNQTLSTGIFNRHFFNLLADYIKRYSEPGEFIWSNYRYIGGILWALTERPSLSYMLREIGYKTIPGNINQAGLLIIIDEPKGQLQKIDSSMGLKLSSYYSLVGIEKAEDTDIYIFMNKDRSTLARYKVPKPFISTGFAYILLAIYLSAIIKIRAHSRVP